MTLKTTIMGCGNSSGMPAIGNFWGGCDPKEPLNRRTRASLLIEFKNTNIVIDTGPDVRNQVNTAGICHIDAVLYSHDHSDHISGIDDLRAFRLRDKKITDIFADQATIDSLRVKYAYLFKDQGNGLYPRVLNPHVMTYGSCKIGNIRFNVFEQDHGTCKSLGFRFGDVAYSTDFIDLDDKAIAVLSGAKVWIADGCGYKMKDNPVHASLNKLYELNERIQAEKVIVTHLSQQMDYRTLEKELPDGFVPAYDGLVLS